MNDEPTVADGGEVEFRLWGDVGVYVDGTTSGPRPDKERYLLVALLVQNGQWISRSGLMEWMWEKPPVSAANDLSKHIGRLRNLLRDAGLGSALESGTGRCRLVVPDELVDVRRFEALVGQARGADHTRLEELQQAMQLLGGALRLSRHEALVGLSGQHIDPYRTQMHEARLDAELLMAEVGIKVGRHREQLPTLTRLLQARPHDSALACLAMHALYLSGRQHEALTEFEAHRKHLVDDGMPVPRGVLDMQTKILNDDPSLRPAVDQGAATEPRATVAHRPQEQHRVQRPAGRLDETAAKDLVLVFNSEAGDPDTLRPLLVDSFGGRGVRVQRADDGLVCVVPPGIAPRQVLGAWLDRLARRVECRVRVGVAFGDLRRARALADSDTAMRVLHNATSTPVVVTVTDELYRLVDRHDADAYLPSQDDVGGWIRVPGYSIPPAPQDHARPAAHTPSPTQAPAPASKAPTVVFNGTTSIGSQHIGDVVHHHGRTAHLGDAFHLHADGGGK